MDQSFADAAQVIFPNKPVRLALEFAAPAQDRSWHTAALRGDAQTLVAIYIQGTIRRERGPG
jgi:hypothetical protein